MIQKKQLAVAIAATFVATGIAYAQSTPQKVEKVEVTGSNIKRTDTETVAPVDVITREQIERSGQPTIAEVLRNVPANTGNSYSESFSNSFAPGASGISLRGLGQKATLVLINGRRTSGYGFAQNLQDSFVDLNSIPSSAVERIEILKDGASAIYGSDAIAGVVNVILRKDYKGIEFSAGAGSAAGKNDYRFAATGGFGDLAKDKYSVLGVFDYYKRDLVLLSDTDFGQSRDWRGRAGGGRNFQSLTGLGTWQQYTNAGASTQNFKAVDNCAAVGGTVLNGPQAVAAGLIDLTSTQSAGNLALLNARASASNTFCTYDQNKFITALPGTERYGLLVKGTFEVTPTLQAYSELGFSKVNSTQIFTPTFFAGSTNSGLAAQGIQPVFNVNFAPGVAGNPFSTLARYAGAQNDLGTRDTSIQSDTYRILAGLKWAFGSWDGDSAVGWSRNSVNADNVNRLDIRGIGAVFNVPTGRQPPIPTSTSSTYNLNNSSLNSAAVRDQVRANFNRTADSELAFADTRASTEFGSLPGGPVGLAVGAEFRNERLKDRPAAIQSGGFVLGQGVTATDGKRDSFAVYAEMGLPITKSLEAQLAVRSDHYSDYGSSTVPKVGLKWKVTPELLLRANWGEGFRAPTLPEISPSNATFFTAVIDPATGAATNISGQFAGNTKLKAEKSKSVTIGAVLEPSKDFNVGLNWYQIDWRDYVSAPSLQSLVDGDGIINGVRRGTITRDPTNGVVVLVATSYYNTPKVLTSGFDFDATYRMTTEFGKVGVRFGASYIEKFRVEDFESTTEYVGRNGFGSTPRLKGNVALNFDQGPWSASATVNYIHSYYQDFLPGSYYAARDQRFQTGVYGTKIGSRTTLDLFGGYEFNNKLKVTASVINVANTLPPYDPGASGTFLYDFTQYDVRGRAFRANLTYKFR